jgi:hypothetical protein
MRRKGGKRVRNKRGRKKGVRNERRAGERRTWI